MQAGQMHSIQKKRTGRSCSVCGRKGHNKRTCPQFVQIEESKKTTQSIPVSYIPSSGTPSEHVVHIPKRTTNIHWDAVEAYEPEQQESTKKDVVDFAELVRQSNINQKAATAPIQQTFPVQKKPSFFAKKKSPRFELPSFFSKEPEVPEKFAKKIPEQKSKGPVFVMPKEKKEKKKKDTTSVWASVDKKVRWKRVSIASFFLFVCSAFSFPVLGYYHQVEATSNSVVRASTHGFSALEQSTRAAFNADIQKAQTDLTIALASLDEATTLVEQEHRLLTQVARVLPIIGPQFESRESLLKGAQHLALGNTYILKGIKEADIAHAQKTERLQVLRDHLAGAVAQYQYAMEQMAHVRPEDLPIEYQATFKEFRSVFSSVVNDMDDVVTLIDGVQLAVGKDDFKRYLLVFQNNREIRATGGFMGSFAVVDVQKGNIVNIEVPPGGTYDVKGQLTEHVIPPLPLQLVNSRWEFHDANWWPDFQASAKKMAWFYEKSRHTTVDGVIAVNATVLENVLRIFGEIALEDYDVTLSSETALDDLQVEVELDYDKEANTPKAVIGDAFSVLLDKVDELDSATLVSLLSTAYSAAANKEIQVYMADDTAQAKFKEFGWTGNIVHTSPVQDYLYVVNTNLQGQKSDARIEQTIQHQSMIDEDGNIINTVVLRRKHTGTPGEQFYGAPNINYVRFYVPEGSELLEAEGFTFPPEEAFKAPEDWYEIDEDMVQYEQGEKYDAKSGTRIVHSFGKTVFENWMMTSPGEEDVVYIVYKLPFKAPMKLDVQHSQKEWTGKLFPQVPEKTSRYSLVVQAQSGVESTFTSQIIYPDGWTPAWKSDEDISLAINGASINTRLTSDRVFGVAMNQPQQP